MPSDTFHAAQPNSVKIGSGGTAFKGVGAVNLGGWSAPSIRVQIDDATYPSYAGYEMVTPGELTIEMRSLENANSNFNTKGALSDDLILVFAGKGDLSGGAPNDLTLTVANPTVEANQPGNAEGRQTMTVTILGHSADGSTDPYGYAFA